METLNKWLRGRIAALRASFVFSVAALRAPCIGPSSQRFSTAC